MASLIRLYTLQALRSGATITLDSGDSHYLRNVMRLSPGDEIALFNGADGEWRAELSTVSKGGCEAVVGERIGTQVAAPDLWLCFAPVKKARIDFLAQKATELGVSRLQPVMTARTAVGRIKLERLKANAKEAAEQCGRMDVPEVAEPCTLRDLLANWPAGRRLMFCDEAGEAPPVLKALDRADGQDGDPWAVLIGPEGGFDAEERALVRDVTGAVPVTLGPRILRADTAAVAALSLWQAALGDWREA